MAHGLGRRDATRQTRDCHNSAVGRNNLLHWAQKPNTTRELPYWEHVTGAKSRLLITITPLSALSAADVAFDADGIKAWSILLAAERVMVEETRYSQLKTHLVGVRVVGHFLSEFWKARGNLLIGGSKPYHTFLKQIKSCEALPSSTASRKELVACYEKISDLGIHYQKHLMRVCGWV